MKFSIAFIVLVTLWAALVVQVFKSNFDYRLSQVQMVSERANAEAAVRDTAVLQNQDLQRRSRH